MKKSWILVVSLIAVGLGSCADESGDEASGGQGAAGLGSGTAGDGAGAGTTTTSVGGGGAGGAISAGGNGGTGGGAGSEPGCPATCTPIPGAPSPYDSQITPGPKTDWPPEEHPDLNMKVRGWEPCTAPAVSCGSTGDTLGLVDIAGPTDNLAPRLHTLFQPARVPAILANYRIYDWDWGCSSGEHGCRGDLSTTWDVNLSAFGTAPEEVLYLADSGYDIGGGHGARVLFADHDSVTLKYTAEDDVVWGYTIHIVGICVEPGLKAKYDADHAAGREQLPALFPSDPVGRACGQKVIVSIRDTGSFMDPRAEKDWWQGHP